MATASTTAVLLAKFDVSGLDHATMRAILSEILVAINGS